MSSTFRLPRRAVVRAGLAAPLALSIRPSLAADPSAAGATHQGLVIGPGPAGRCDDYKVGIGTPLFDRAAKLWKMWYYCRDQRFPKDFAPTLGSGRIALATSRDGLSWQRFDGPGTGGSVLEPSANPDDFDAMHIGNTDVTFAHGEFWLWYFGGNRVPAKTKMGEAPGLAMLPGLARSKDGVSWTKVRGPGRGGALFNERPGDVFASWTNGVWDGEKFIMWYTATGPDAQRFDTYHAVSKDGVHWTQRGPISLGGAPRVYDGMGMMTRHVVPNPFRPGPRWLMLYTALDAATERRMRRSIAAATSDDGVVWTRLYDGPIFEAQDADAWDGGGVAGPQLAVLKSELRLYYFGFPVPAKEAALPKGVGLAIAPGNDLRGFKRYTA
jgi:hypothetical protein